jgi:hypothetical protein
MSTFTLMPIFDANTFLLRDLPLSQLRLENNSQLPWFLLVPKRPNLTELFQLNPADQMQVMKEIVQTSNMLRALFAPDKINVATIGNMVPQMHIHVVGRYKNDPAWPKPVWGNLQPLPYAPQAVDDIKAKVDDEKFWAD